MSTPISLPMAARFTLPSRCDIMRGTSVRMTGAYHEGPSSSDREAASTTFSLGGSEAT